MTTDKKSLQLNQKERVISLCLSLLPLFRIRRQSKFDQAIRGAVSLALLNRAISGRCRLKQAFTPVKRVVQKSVTINEEPQVVFENWSRLHEKSSFSKEVSEDENCRGKVFFKPKAGRGTEVKIVVEEKKSDSVFHATVRKIFGDGVKLAVENDLKKLKQLVETGEIATTTGQPSDSRWYKE